MPQNNVLPDWRATYPNDAPAQKPGGVTVSTTATAPRVPNKFTYNAGTIQMVSAEGVLQFLTPEGESVVEEPQAATETVEEETVEEPVEEESVEEEEEAPTPTKGKPRRR